MKVFENIRAILKLLVIEYINFVKRNIAPYLTGSLFDTVMKSCARERKRARRLKKETFNVLP